MAWLKKILGQNFEKSFQKAEDLFAAGDAGWAKITYERAVADAGKDAPLELVEKARSRILECRRILSRQHVEKARDFVSHGDIDLARESFLSALEVTPDDDEKRRIREETDSLHAVEARIETEEVQELDDDALYNIIMGTWNEPQINEFERLGEPARKAMLASHDGRLDEALAILDDLARNDSGDGCYLFLEQGQILMVKKESARAAEAFDRFLERLPDEEDDEIWIRALTLYGQAKLDAGDLKEAEEALREAAAVRKSNYMGFLNLGVFLRLQKRPEEALQFLTKAEALRIQTNPDFRMLREIGLCHLDLGNKADAKTYLGQVIHQQAAMDQFDQLDPTAAVILARLHEEDGDFKSASDLYRHLAEGSDRTRFFEYNREAGRLLIKADLKDMALKYLKRASELAPDPESKQAVEDMLKTLSV